MLVSHYGDMILDSVFADTEGAELVSSSGIYEVGHVHEGEDSSGVRSGGGVSEVMPAEVVWTAESRVVGETSVYSIVVPRGYYYEVVKLAPKVATWSSLTLVRC